MKDSASPHQLTCYSSALTTHHIFSFYLHILLGPTECPGSITTGGPSRPGRPGNTAVGQPYTLTRWTPYAMWARAIQLCPWLSGVGKDKRGALVTGLASLWS